MGWINRISQILEPNHLLYAVGQGALAVECRSNDMKILNMLQNLMCLTTTCRILVERSFLKTLGGGCSAPVAVSTQIKNGNNLEKTYNNKNDNDDYANTNDDNDIRLNITGAVWSLDGTTEIKNSIDCCLTLERKRKISEHEEQQSEIQNYDKDDESPKKKKKLNEEEEEEDEQSQQLAKQSSPKIVNDDKFTQELITTAVTSGAGDGIKLPNLQHLINIHGELFKKCPFYAQHQKDRENGNASTKKDECPLNIPIGQDFMGKCPYVDTTQKVELSEKFDKVCPITGNTIKPDSSCSSNNNDVFAQGDTINIIQQKCPFKVMKSSNNDQNLTTTNNSEELGHEKCPFIQKNIIKLIDYDEEKQKLQFIESNDQTPTNPPILIDDSEQLFCGLYRHKCYSNDLFIKCEKLGQQLANTLIQKGALDVMKCAQQEIREK